MYRADPIASAAEHEIAAAALAATGTTGTGGTTGRPTGGLVVGEHFLTTAVGTKTFSLDGDPTSVLVGDFLGRLGLFGPATGQGAQHSFVT